MSSTRLMACQGEGSMILSCVQFNYESYLLGAFKLFFMRKNIRRMKNDKVKTRICLDINVKLVDRHEKPFFVIVFCPRRICILSQKKCN